MLAYPSIPQSKNAYSCNTSCIPQSKNTYSSVPQSKRRLLVRAIDLAPIDEGSEPVHLISTEW